MTTEYVMKMRFLGVPTLPRVTTTLRPQTTMEHVKLHWSADVFFRLLATTIQRQTTTYLVLVNLDHVVECHRWICVRRLRPVIMEVKDRVTL